MSDGVLSGEIWADYVDGQRALRQRVRIGARQDYRGLVLAIEKPDGQIVHWPLREIRRLPDQAPGGAVSYGVSLADGARILVTEPNALTFMEGLGRQVKGRLAGPILWPRALRVVVVGAAILATLLFLVLPRTADILARFMDSEAEQRMGEADYALTREMFGGFDGPLEECDAAEGLAALDRLVARVAGDVALPYDLRLAVLDDGAEPMLNAYAVAGGRITFFESLILLAESPEEVAAVLAHELGHVVNRDPVRRTLQDSSSRAVLAVLVGDLTGGGVLTGVTGEALTSGVSRAAETQADVFAFRRLTETGLPPSALGRFFGRARAVWGEDGGLVRHFSSHPQIADRIAASAAAGDPVIGAPALTPEEWTALRAICG